MNDTETPAPWALELLNDVGPNELSALRNIGVPASEKRMEAARVIQGIVEKGKEMIPAPKATKRGPKNRDSVNQTERDISTLYQVVRMILGLPFDTSVPDVLAKLAHFLRRSQSYFQEKLLLKKREREMVDSLIGELWDVCQEGLLLAIFDGKFSEPIEGMVQVDNPADWVKNIKSLPRGITSESAALTPAQRVDALLSDIARALNLIDESLPNPENKEMQADLCKKPLKRNLIEARGSQKKSILWAAVGRLFHINSCFSETQYAWTPEDAETFFFGIEGLNTPSMCGEPPARPDRRVREIIEILKQIVLTYKTRLKSAAGAPGGVVV